MKKRNIIVTGTPGTGKTTIAKRLAKELNLKYIDVAVIIKKDKIHEGYNRSEQCYIVPIPMLQKKLDPLIKEGNIVIDSHLSHYLKPKGVDLAIVTRCTDLKKLKRRLEKRNYSKGKVRENLDCEIIDLCLTEAKERKFKTIEVDTAKKVDYAALIRRIKRTK